MTEEATLRRLKRRDFSLVAAAIDSQLSQLPIENNSTRFEMMLAILEENYWTPEEFFQELDKYKL